MPVLVLTPGDNSGKLAPMSIGFVSPQELGLRSCFKELAGRSYFSGALDSFHASSLKVLADRFANQLTGSGLQKGRRSSALTSQMKQSSR